MNSKSGMGSATDLTIDSKTEIDLDSSDTLQESTVKATTHEKQLVSEAADSLEDNTNDL
jgi:hypothetical protein